MNKDLELNWNASYPECDGKQLWPEEVVPVVDLARRFFKPATPILDLPCGDGKNVFALAAIGPVVAVDASSRALRICGARCRRSEKSNVVIMTGDIFHTPFLDGSFESIFCCDLLGHLPNPEGALDELRRIVSPGGTVIGTLFTTRDSVLDDPRMDHREDGSYMFRNKFYFRFYTEDEAQALCVGAGFDVLELREFTWWEDPHVDYREYRHMHSSWGFALRRT